jgi:hypothetical protein
MKRNQALNAIAGYTAAPTPERLAKGDEVDTIETAVELGRAKAYRISQTPMDRYLRRRVLDPDPHTARIMFDCGESYYALRRMARMVPHSACRGLDRVDGGDEMAVIERVTDAARQIIALDAKLGPAHVDVLRAVCVEGWTAEGWARSRGYLHAGQGMAFLRDALLVLAGLWGKVDRRAA